MSAKLRQRDTTYYPHLAAARARAVTTVSAVTLIKTCVLHVMHNECYAPHTCDV